MNCPPLRVFLETCKGSRVAKGLTNWLGRPYQEISISVCGYFGFCEANVAPETIYAEYDGGRVQVSRSEPGSVHTLATGLLKPFCVVSLWS